MEESDCNMYLETVQQMFPENYLYNVLQKFPKLKSICQKYLNYKRLSDPILNRVLISLNLALLKTNKPFSRQIYIIIHFQFLKIPNLFQGGQQFSKDFKI